MREIKFRVWDIENQKYHYPDEMYGECMGPGTETVIWVLAGAMNNVSDEFQENHILEQFTGLHDKNGKEWFEGDISEDEDNCYGVVVFEEGSFCFKWYERCERGHNEYIETTKMTDYHYDAMKIVGNIHEEAANADN